MYFIIVNADNDLQHHGILGQKWGVRRYQNPDGTLTGAGKKRYQEAENVKNLELKRAYDAAQASGEKLKHIESLSNYDNYRKNALRSTYGTDDEKAINEALKKADYDGDVDSFFKDQLGFDIKEAYNNYMVDEYERERNLGVSAVKYCMERYGKVEAIDITGKSAKQVEKEIKRIK